MINISEILKLIPEVMKFFVPGYIAISMKRYFRSESSKDEKHIILLSVTISFILNILLGNILNIVSIKQYDIPILFFFSILVGYILTILPGTRIFNFVRKNIFKSDLVPYSSVWTYVMKSKNKVWARVYIKDLDIGYTGKLISYSLGEEEREIYLEAFTSFRLKDYSVIEDFSKNDENCVIINCKDISCIEILK